MGAVSFEVPVDAFAREFAPLRSAVRKAETATIRDAAAEILRRGRANLAQAFPGSARWPDSLQVIVYPAGGSQGDAAAFIYDRISYAGLFEDGGTITGQPLLWLPLPSVPLGVGGRPLAPRDYAARFAPLVSIVIPGHRPLLGAKSTTGRVVPLYVGINQVEIRKRIDIRGIVANVAAGLPDSFAKHLGG